MVQILLLYNAFVKQFVDPESTANFLEPGGDGCVLRVASCEVKTL